MPEGSASGSFDPRQVDAAWSAEDGLALAERLAELAGALRARFGSEVSAR